MCLLASNPRGLELWRVVFLGSSGGGGNWGLNFFERFLWGILIYGIKLSDKSLPRRFPCVVETEANQSAEESIYKPDFCPDLLEESSVGQSRWKQSVKHERGGYFLYVNLSGGLVVLLCCCSYRQLS